MRDRIVFVISTAVRYATSDPLFVTGGPSTVTSIDKQRFDKLHVNTVPGLPSVWCLACIGFLIACQWSVAVAADVSIRLSKTDGRALVDAVVYLPASSAREAPKVATLWTIRQRARVFDPFVTVVQKGDRVEFPNDDDMLHHIYSTSPAKTFEIKLYRGSSSPVQFDNPGIVAIGCNLHDWMLAYVVVLEAGSFAKTDRNGVAHLSDVLPGTYSISAWYPGMRQPAVLGDVVVAAQNNATVEHMLNVPIRARPRAPPLNPLKY